VHVTTEIKVNFNPTIPGNVEIPNPNIKLYELAYSKFVKLVKNKGHGVGDMVILVGIAVQVSQTIKRGEDMITGKEKKAIVINIIKCWVDDSPDFADEDKVYLKEMFIPCVLDGVIDGLCSLNLNKVAKKATANFLKMCCGADVIDQPISADRHELVRDQ